MNVGIPPVILKAARKHTASLVFLHGLGDTGLGWAGALNTIKPDYLKVICPTAPMMPVTLNGGMKMPAWYDILSLDETDENREDMEGVDWAVNFLLDIVREEEKQGISSDRVMVGGFSQGGAVSLRAALTSQTPLAGCVALSCYLPGDISQYNNLNTQDTPVFQVTLNSFRMYFIRNMLQAHGDQDDVVTYPRGKLTAEVVSRLVRDHQFNTYEGMSHEATLKEMEDVKTWMDQKLNL